MNKLLISILFVAMLIGCTKQPQSFTLHGTTENADLNGVVVYLYTFCCEGEGWSVIDSTVIENQLFAFEGVVQEPIRGYLVFTHPEEYHSRWQIFILENANINFNITENIEVEVSGNKNNNLMYAFNNDFQSIIPQEFWDSVENNLLSIAEQRLKFNYYRSKQRCLTLDFSTENVNTVVGTFVFLDYSDVLFPEERIAVFDAMNETTKNRLSIQRLIQSTEAEQRVSAGQPFIDFTLPTPTGEMLSFSDVVGNHDYVLLHFWASWCGPCIGFFPELTEFYRNHAGKSFEIFSVSLDGDKENWENAIKEFGLTWHHVSDLKDLDCEVRQLYGVTRITHYTLIDRNGIIVGGRELSLDEIAELLNKR